MKNIQHHTALVTGAASGLGYEFSLLLAKDKFDLVMVDINNKKLKDAKTSIKKRFKVSIKMLVKDLSQPNAAAEIFNNIQKPIDVLINNAGFGLFGAFAHTDWRRESDMLNLHINATTQLTKLALKSMVERNHGKILNVSSVAAFQPGPLMSIYYASKAYILSFSEAIANELKGSGVTVTALCPGQTKTSFQEVVSKNTVKNRIKFNMASAKMVANYGYQAMMKEKIVAIPGRINKLLANLPRIIPRNLVTSMVRRIQEKNRSSQAKPLVWSLTQKI